MTESKTPQLDTAEMDPLGKELALLAEAIAVVTIGHDDIKLAGASSRKADIGAYSTMILVYREDGLSGLGPEIMIQRESIEEVNGRPVLKRHVLKWPKNYSEIIGERNLTIINPSAEKDIRRQVNGTELNKHDKDLAVAMDLVRQAKELVVVFNDKT